MRQVLKDLMLVAFFVLMFAAIPFALSPYNPLRQSLHPSHFLADPSANLTLYAALATFLVLALGAPMIPALDGTGDDSDAATQLAERMEEHLHD